MEEYVGFVKNIFETYGLWFIFPIVLLENFPVIGFILPGMTALLLAGFLLVDNLSSLLLVVLVAYSGMVCGDNLWFFLGRLTKGKWKCLNNVNDGTHELLDVINKQSIYVLLFYQFVPYLRMFLPYTFGISNYKINNWFFINLIGSFLFVNFVVVIGYISGKVLKDLEGIQIIGKNLNTIFITLGIIYAIILIMKFLSVRKKRKKK